MDDDVDDDDISQAESIKMCKRSFRFLSDLSDACDF